MRSLPIRWLVPTLTLLVADEPGDASDLEPLATGLRAHGVAVQPIVTPSALRRRGGFDADVVVLDVHRSGAAGLDRLLHVRQQGGRPVVVLTDHDGDAVVRALRLGADDAVRLPVTPEELALRVTAAHRRSAQRSVGRTLADGPLVVDESARSVRVGEHRVDLTNRELDLLVHLIEHAGLACTRDELLRAVWGSNSSWQTPATVTEHVRRIRVKLRAAGVDVGITALRGAGYRYDGASPAVGAGEAGEVPA